MSKVPRPFSRLRKKCGLLYFEFWRNIENFCIIVTGCDGYLSTGSYVSVLHRYIKNAGSLCFMPRWTNADIWTKCFLSAVHLTRYESLRNFKENSRSLSCLRRHTGPISTFDLLKAFGSKETKKSVWMPKTTRKFLVFWHFSNFLFKMQFNWLVVPL